MKTNQVMTVAFDHGTISIEHKTSMGDLADVFTIGNRHRGLAGKYPANITHFCNSVGTKAFIAAVAKRLNVGPETLLYTKGKGKSSRVIANIFIIIYAAEYLSPDFHVEVIDTFINANILSWRDESGDSFKWLNDTITDLASDVLMKPAHKGHFITIAKIVNSRIGSAIDWNLATAAQLKERDRIEQALVTILKLGLVTDWEHLKQIAAEV
jgi:hypothetical protein